MENPPTREQPLETRLLCEFSGVGALVRKHLFHKLFPNSSRLLQMCRRFLATILIRLRGRDSRTRTATRDIMCS